MKPEKQARLEAAGFKVSTIEEFLGLTSEESDLVDVRLALSAAIRQKRESLPPSKNAHAI